MYCRNCGEKAQEDALFCAKCGYALKSGEVMERSTNIATVKKEGSGTAIASMVLGILGVIFGIISLLIALAYSTYESYTYMDLYGSLSREYQSAKTLAAIMIVFLPAVLSIIGFSLAIASRGKLKNGANTAGLVLNIITIIICILDFIMIAG